MMIELMHLGSVGEEFSIGDPERRQLKLKHACNLLLAATDHQWQTAHRHYKFRWQRWLTQRSLQVRDMILINTRNSAHDFSVKLSPCICSQTDSRCWHNMWCLAISGEDLSRYLLVRDKSCFVQWQINLLLAQACPTMMNHHTSSPTTMHYLLHLFHVSGKQSFLMLAAGVLTDVVTWWYPLSKFQLHMCMRESQIEFQLQGSG